MLELTSNLEIIVCQIRNEHPTMALKSMYTMIKPQGIGRDKFMELCKEKGYGGIKRYKPIRTTDSTGVKRFENMLIGLEITGINQVWSSDITYYKVEDEVFYLTFIIDNYSRLIVGWSTSTNLTTEDTTLKALKRALKERKSVNLTGLIFHSDGGGQYYAHEFRKLIQANGIQSSMCEYAYENGKAERINGVIKNNYLRHWDCSNFEKLAKNVDRACYNYNMQKPHSALKGVSPFVFEQNLLDSY